MYLYNLGLRFQQASKEYSSNKALIFSEKEYFTYEEYNFLGNQLANLLLKKGAVSGDVVLISGKKVLSSYVMILACLKLGLIYSFYDPKSPDKRLKKIFSKCKPKFLLAETIPNFVNSDSAKNYLQCHLPNEDKVFKKLIKS